MEVSLREFSRRIGVSLRTVQVAIESKRITAFRTEQAGIRTRIFVDQEKALQEWKDNTNHFNRNQLTRGEMEGRGLFGEGPEGKWDLQAPAAAPVPAKKPPAKAAEAPPKARKSDLPAPVMAVSQTESTYQKARGAREVYSAKMLELKFQLESKALVPVEAVKKLFYDIGKTVQQNLMNIPARISPIVAAEVDEKKVHDMIENEVVKALEILSDGNLESLTR
jgi:hypothetical protein